MNILNIFIPYALLKVKSNIHIRFQRLPAGLFNIRAWSQIPFLSNKI